MFTLATNRQKKVFCSFSISFFRYYHQKTKKNCSIVADCASQIEILHVILKMDFHHYVAFKMYEGGGVGGGHWELLFSFLLKRRKGKWAKSIWSKKKKKRKGKVFGDIVFSPQLRRVQSHIMLQQQSADAPMLPLSKFILVYPRG